MVARVINFIAAGALISSWLIHGHDVSTPEFWFWFVLLLAVSLSDRAIGYRNARTEAR